MMRVDLTGVWTLSEPGTGLRIDVDVPGSVFHDLLKDGQIDDPFYRYNEEQAIGIADKTYTYERKFQLSEADLKLDQLVLVCEGLDTLAHIFVNGTEVGHTENMHRRYEFDVRSLVRAGENQILISFDSSVAYLRAAHRENPIWGQGDTMAGFTHLRKAHYMFGWDWGPKIPDAGIFRPIYLAGYNHGRLTDVLVEQSHQEDGSVKVHVQAEADCFDEGQYRMEVRLVHPNGSSEKQWVPLQGGEFAFTFFVDDPQLWWPNGYGEQPLYRVEASVVQVESALTALDTKSLRIGLRTLTVARNRDSWGESFEFVVNGVPLFAKGANYIPEDSLPGRRTQARTRRLFEDCLEANFNLIRVWGGGFYPDDWFYDLADEMGFIVWQDFMYACGTYALTPSFEANIREETEDVVRRIRHHASLGILCGNNEMEEAWVDWDFPKTEELRADYLRHFEQVLPEICQRLAPQTFYWPASPSCGGGFDNPNDENRGDVHYWDVWHGLKPFTEYRKFHFRFCSEFGFQSFPSMKTIEKFTLPEDRNVFSYVMEKHQKNNAANGKILYYLSDNFQYPKDLDSLVYASQVLQAEAIKYGVEHWRRNRGRCMGAIYWQLNDCWPVASWSSIDYYGRWKALHYFAKRFYQPVLLSAAETETGATLVVTNDQRVPVEGRVRYALCRQDGSVLTRGEVGLFVDPLSAKVAATLDYASELPDIHARRNAYLSFEWVVGDEVVDRATVLFVKAKHFEFRNPEIAAAVEENEDGFTIRLNAKSYAKYVELDLAQADARFTDNYFDLVPGSERVIRMDKSKLSRKLSIADVQQQLRIRSLYDTYHQ